MAILDEGTREEVRRRLAGLEGPVTLVVFKSGQETSASHTLEDLGLELAQLTDKLVLKVFDLRTDTREAREHGVDRAPALVVEGRGGVRTRYFGLPGGYEFSALLENLQDAAAGHAELSAAARRKLEGLRGPAHIKVFVSPGCPHCPAALRTAQRIAQEFPQVRADMIEAGEFPDLAREYGVTGVPKVVVNDAVEFTGALPESAFAQAVVAGAQS